MKRGAIIMLLTGCIMLTGCWSSSPIEDLNMEVGVALDLAEETGDKAASADKAGNYPKEKEIICTYQFIVPQGSVGSKKDGSQSRNYYNMVETGNSIFEAVRDLALRTNRPPIGHHLKIIVIGEQLARSIKISELIEFYSRDNDIRPSVILLVSSGKASELLNNSLPGQTPAFVLEGIFNNRNRNSKIWQPVCMVKAVGYLHGKHSFLLQNVITHGKEPEFAGAGVISGTTGRLSGFMNQSELEGIVWLTGKGRGGVLKTYGPDNEQLITYEIKSMKSKIKAIVKGGKISFEVTIRSAGRLAEVFTANGEKLDEAFIQRAEEALQKQVEDKVRASVEKMQHELHADVGGFGQSLYIQHPAAWRTVKEDWDENFSELPISYNVKLNIEEYGASGTTTD